MKKIVCCALVAFAAFIPVASAEHPSCDAHYLRGAELFNRCDYEGAINELTAVIENSPRSTYFAESHYLLGIALFKRGEFDFANEAFSQYLKCTNQPKYFEKVIGYKYEIAEKYRLGAKRHVFNSKKMPKWADGRALALQLYDEVVYALPCHELAALSLYAKASMLWEEGNWKEAVDSFQTLIRRFPKHELAPQGYLCINRVYLEQSKKEFQNPDLIILSQINLKKFAKDFPKDERLANAEADVQAIKEVYARGLYCTGKYYERTGKPGASIIYYQSTIKQFPDTKTAQICRQRLEVLAPKEIASGP